MITVVTHLTIQPGKESAWDAAYRRRLAIGKQQPGWVATQLCSPGGAVNERISIGTWETRADWEAWVASQMSQKSGEQLERAEAEARRRAVYEVILEEHR